ncbi:MAG: hypothetical protein J2P25_07255 [Nocardiopsaceae bacterium]|nr:hypothetical protein [Nocardiopsaceae bacterium]
MREPLASVNVGQSFQNLLNTVMHAIPQILVFLVVLVVGWIVAKVLARVVDMLLRRVKFDHFVERGAIGQALRRSNTDATSLIAKIVYYAILLIALQMAFGVFGTNPISSMLDGIVAWLPRAIVAIIIIVIASAIAKVVKDLIVATIGGLSYGRFLASVASIIIIALGAIAALNQVGIADAITTPILDTVLITCGAVIAIGVGGGLIKPMQNRWERMLTAAERETNAQLAAYQQGRSDAMRAPSQERPGQGAQQQGYAAQGGPRQGPSGPQGGPRQGPTPQGGGGRPQGGGYGPPRRDMTQEPGAPGNPGAPGGWQGSGPYA